MVVATGRQFGCNMISAISNRGTLGFMVFKARWNAKLFIEFLARLLRVSEGRKLFLIVDSHPAHKAAKVTRWLEEKSAERSGRLELSFLPGYSPELNPDECPNQDTKQAMRKARPHDAGEMMTPRAEPFEASAETAGVGQTILP